MINSTKAEAFIAQWELANEMLDQLEGREKEEAFDLMMAAAIELGREGDKLTPDNHWHLSALEGDLDPQ